MGGACQIRDRPPDLQHSMVGPGRKPEPLDGRPQEGIGAIGELAAGADVTRRHVRVGVHVGAARLQATAQG